MDSIKGNTPSPLSLNGTWQIPDALMSHSFIMLMVGRYGRYGTNLVSVNEIRDSAYNSSDGALAFPEGSLAGYWRIYISQTGVIKLTTMVNTSNQPNIIAYGIL